MLQGKDAGSTGGRSKVDLLGYLAYDPSAWYQGRCGNCWVWACTAALGIHSGVQGLKVPLSVQYFNSNYRDGAGACCGGYVERFVSFYNQMGQFVPSTNTNAEFVDALIRCGTQSSRRASQISTQGGIPFVELIQTRVPTFLLNTRRSEAISAIKAQIDHKVPVVISFFLSKAGWSEFEDWWDSSSEDVVWTGFEDSRGSEAGHASTLVGYDDGDHSWILLNSWGTTSVRPNGLIRIPQDLAYAPPDSSKRRLEFDVLQVQSYNTTVTMNSNAAKGTVPTGSVIAFTGACTDDFKGPLSYAWDFGDGMTEYTTERTTTHAFINASGRPQTYRVKLSVGAMVSYRSPLAGLGKAFMDIVVEP